MDFYSLGFIFVIVMVSGVIAYLADIYGRKLGKKRLSIMGLRPRHTATIATVALGMAVSTLTIGLVMLFSAPVRHWVLQGSKALEDLKVAENRLKDAQDEVQSTQQQISELKDKLRQGHETLATQKTQISVQKSNIEGLKLVQDNLKSTLTQTRLSLADKTNKIRLDENRIQATGIKLQKNKADLERVSNALLKSIGSSKRQLLANKALLKSNEDLGNFNGKLSSDIGTQRTELLFLDGQKKQLDASLAKLNADYIKNTNDLKDLKQELSLETDNLSKAKDEYGKLAYFAQENILIFRTSPMIYRMGQEICRIPLPANLTSQDAQTAIGSLLQKAQVEVEHRGAKSHGSMSVADVMARPNGTSAEQIKSLAETKLTGQASDVVLMAVSSVNAFADEPVSVDFVIDQNPIVYTREEKIGECDVDGTQSDQFIVRKLVDFGAKLRQRAKSDKMIPQADDNSFGSLTGDQVLGLLDKIKQRGRLVRLEAKVLYDTHAADPLKLDFLIR